MREFALFRFDRTAAGWTTDGVSRTVVALVECAMPFLVYARCPFWYLRACAMPFLVYARFYSARTTNERTIDCTKLAGVQVSCSTKVTTFSALNGSSQKWQHKALRLSAYVEIGPINQAVSAHHFIIIATGASEAFGHGELNT